MIHPSTYSIVAYDPEEQAWGCAVASKFLAVGSVVPWAKANVGVIATQSYANTTFGSLGLELLEQGNSAENTMSVLLGNDPQADLRQVGIVDAQGNAATYTGSGCYEWAGGITGAGYAIQGNILAGENVVVQMEKMYVSTDEPFSKRLYRALMAGEKAGGDRRGKQSAAILVVKYQGGYGGFNDRWIDLRVDDHTSPVERLGDMLELHDLYFGKSPEQDRIYLVGEPLHKLQAIMIRQGYYHGPENGEYTQQTKKALEAFMGNENFEDRVDFENGTIDLPVFAYIRKHFCN